VSERYILTLYGRERCHLCEEMFEDLQPLLAETAVTLEEIDVDLDPDQRKRYGLRVPVLVAADGQVLAEGRLEPGSLRQWLDGLASDPPVHP
jgi:thioredoxin-like negative regulator of GroEL